MQIDIFSKLHDFFTDNKRSIGSKFSYAVLIIFLLLSADLIFKPSYSLFQSNKLAKLEKIGVLKSEFANEPKTIAYLNEMQENVIKSKHYTQHIQSLWSSLLEGINGSNTHTTTNIDHNNKPKLSIIYTALSSSLFFIILILFMLLNPIMNKDYSIKNLGASITAALIGFIITLIITSVLMFIPVLGYTFVNYIIYFAFQVFIIYLLTKISN